MVYKTPPGGGGGKPYLAHGLTDLLKHMTILFEKNYRFLLRKKIGFGTSVVVPQCYILCLYVYMVFSKMVS